MYYTIKTLLKCGKNISEISRDLSINRKTTRKGRDRIVREEITPSEIEKASKLDPEKEPILEYLSQGLTIVLIHQRLLERGVKIKFFRQSKIENLQYGLILFTNFRTYL